MLISICVEKMKRFNKYDLLIILTIVTLAWGNNDALRFLYPIRIIGFVGLFVVASDWRLINKEYMRWCLLFVIWSLYIIISLIWAPNPGDAIAQAFHIITVFGAMGLMMVAALKAKEPLNSLITGWVAMVLITLPIAFWEISTGNHLASGSYHADTMAYGQLRVFAAVTFGNINSYAVVLAFAFPFVIAGLVGNKKEAPFRLLLMVITAIIGGLILLSASRGCLLCFIFGLLLILLLQLKGKFSFLSFFMMVFILLGGLYYVIEKLELNLLFEITARLENEGFETVRGEIYQAGLEAASNSAYLGGGVGSTVPYMIKYTNCPVKVTHNAFLEILIEYGVFIFLYFWCKFYSSAMKLWKSGNIKVKIIGAYYTVATLVLFLIDDYYTGESVFWVFTASLIVLSNLYGKKKRRGIIAIPAAAPQKEDINNTL